jgi:autotransporter passenger strand-loop-strand repeat protein
VVSAGGTETVYGTADANRVGSGGTIYAESGATVSGLVINSGGTAVIAGGVGLSGTITFGTAGGSLQLGEALGRTDFVSGFATGDSIGLDFAYSAGETVSVTTPGLVTVTSGGVSEQLNIAGTTSSTNLQVISGTNGSATLIKAVAPAVTHAATQMAFVKPAAASTTATHQAALFSTPVMHAQTVIASTKAANPHELVAKSGGASHLTVLASHNSLLASLEKTHAKWI